MRVRPLGFSLPTRRAGWPSASRRLRGAMLLRSIFLALLGWLVAGVTQASADAFDDNLAAQIPDAAAAAGIQAALSKIHEAKCEDDLPCAPASEHEFSNPPITNEDSRAAMVYGIKSALADWCGLDWKRSFLPMIAYGKLAKKMNDRQLQLMGQIHGDFMGRQVIFYRNSGACPEHVTRQLDIYLPKLKS